MPSVGAEWWEGGPRAAGRLEHVCVCAASSAGNGSTILIFACLACPPDAPRVAGVSGNETKLLLWHLMATADGERHSLRRQSGSLAIIHDFIKSENARKPFQTVPGITRGGEAGAVCGSSGQCIYLPGLRACLEPAPGGE